MKFKRTTYPDYPDVQGSPCWQIISRRIFFDADWNTRFPYGTSLCLRAGLRSYRGAPGFTLDVNPPLGEPNRLYLWLGPWRVIIGLPSVRDLRDTGRTRPLRGTELPVFERFTNWRHPHLDGCSRYKYHQDSSGRWVRNGKPEPLHWGWLTAERRKDSYTGS